MSNFAQIDLSELPAPELIEPLSFETIMAEIAADYQGRNPDAILLEADPAYKVLETAAYRELRLRQSINERARQTLLAFATQNNLEHLAAFYGVARGLIDPGDRAAQPPVDPVWETDTSLRARTQLAPEALSVAGPKGGYIFHALSAGREIAGMDIAAPSEDTVTITYTFVRSDLAALAKDASAISPSPGSVVTTILGRDGDGTASPALLAAVDAALSDEFVRPLTDQVTVRGAEILSYRIVASLDIPPGPDPSVIERAARANLAAYAASVHKLSGVAARSGFDAALHVAGVSRVILTEPAADILCNAGQAPFCTSIEVSLSVVRAADPGDV